VYQHIGQNLLISKYFKPPNWKLRKNFNVGIKNPPGSVLGAVRVLEYNGMPKKNNLFSFCFFNRT